MIREVTLAQPPRRVTLRTGDQSFTELPLGLRTLSPTLEQELAKLQVIATSTTPIVILGETGTGKELIAQAIHKLSRRNGRLRPVQCGALPPTTVESELFGHVKGAFTDAIADKEGAITEAQHGTLFLDEIGELPARVQAIFLRVLQDGKVTPVGGVEKDTIVVDFRLVTATHRDLLSMIESAEFRQDLWGRLHAYKVCSAPLRDRLEDLGLILGTLLRKYAPADRVPRFTRRAAAALFACRWPENIRQLENLLQPAVALAVARDVPEIVATDWPPELAVDEPGVTKQAAPVPIPSEPALRRARLEQLLEEHGGNVSEIARVTGHKRQLLDRWLITAGLKEGKSRRPPDRE